LINNIIIYPKLSHFNEFSPKDILYCTIIEQTMQSIALPSNQQIIKQLTIKFLHGTNLGILQMTFDKQQKLNEVAMKTNKQIIAIITILIAITSLLSAQDIGQWRMTTNFTVSDNPTGETLPTAYLLSVLSNYYGVKKFQEAGMSWWKADLTTFSLGLLWEVKDGLVPENKVPIFGGNGFSTTDLTVNASVIITNRILDFATRKLVRYVSNKRNTGTRYANK